MINDSYGVFGGVVNTLCLGFVGGVTNAANSIFLKTANIDVDGDPRLVDCLECEAEDIAVDPLTYAPLPGTAHPALDAGDPSLGAHDWYGDTDVWGNQRVWNGRMDIGAVEADWRDRYAAGVSGSRKFSVVKATAGVTETEGGKVRIADGEELVAEWANRSLRMARYSLAFDVTGNGTVSLVVNGETTVCSGSGKSFVHTFDSASELNEIAIGYEGDDCGYVTLVSCSRSCGTLISIR